MDTVELTAHRSDEYSANSQSQQDGMNFVNIHPPPHNRQRGTVPHLFLSYVKILAPTEAVLRQRLMSKGQGCPRNT